MQNQTIKQEAIEAITRLPETADMEEIIYRLYVLENIRRGQHDAEHGNSMPVDQGLQFLQTAIGN